MVSRLVHSSTWLPVMSRAKSRKASLPSRRKGTSGRLMSRLTHASAAGLRPPAPALKALMSVSCLPPEPTPLVPPAPNLGVGLRASFSQAACCTETVSRCAWWLLRWSQKLWKRTPDVGSAELYGDMPTIGCGQPFTRHRYWKPPIGT